MKLEDRKILVPIMAKILEYANTILPVETKNYTITKFNLHYEIECGEFPKPRASFDIDLLDALNYELLHPLSEEEQTQSSEQTSS